MCVCVCLDMVGLSQHAIYWPKRCWEWWVENESEVSMWFLQAIVRKLPNGTSTQKKKKKNEKRRVKSEVRVRGKRFFFVSTNFPNMGSALISPEGLGYFTLFCF